MDDNIVLLPNLILDTVNIVAVAVLTPPNKPQNKLAKPWPNASLSEKWRFPDILSAITQVKRLSIIISPDNANAGNKNSLNL